MKRSMPQKFRINEGENTLQVPGGLCGVHIDGQAGSLFLWTTARIDEPVQLETIYVARTGEVIPVEWRSYLGTALLNGGGSVLHAYHMKSEVKNV